MSGRINKWLVAAIVLALLAGGLMLAVYEVLHLRPAGVAARDTPALPQPDTTSAAKPRISAENLTAVDPHVIDDDGHTLWASPTSGPPLDLSFLPPGCQVIAVVHPSKLTPAVMHAIGPLKRRIERALTFGITSTSSFHLMPRIIVGIQVGSNGEWQVARVRQYPKLEPEVVAGFPEVFPADDRRSRNGSDYALTRGEAWYLTSTDKSGALAVATEALIKEIIDLGGAAPPLRRDMERLLPLTDDTRPVTILFAPNFLFGDGQSMFTGEFARLREPLFWFLDDTLSAASLSMNWDENFFIEFVAVPTLDTRPEEAARQLAARVAEMPKFVEEYVARLDPQPYGRRVVERFPAMVRALAAYTRVGVEDDCVVMRCYLPAIAGQNLIMGAELTLAEPPGASASAGPRTSVPAAEAASPVDEAPSVGEILKRPTSLRVSRDSLEAVLDQLSQSIGAEIVILGPDLQADGITRNQQLAIDMVDRPAAEILLEILKLANPDKSAGGPADARQKLVYLVKRQDPGGAEAIYITTRARAAERGDTLPAVFRP